MPDIEESIQKAIQEGKFKDLSGKGKPLNLSEDPHADPEWRLAHHILRSAGYTLPWIELRQEIEAETAAALAALQRAWEQAGKQSGAAKDRLFAVNRAAQAEWRGALDRFMQQVERINKRIFDYNLQVPSPNFQLHNLKAEREIERITAAD